MEGIASFVKEFESEESYDQQPPSKKRQKLFQSVKVRELKEQKKKDKVKKQKAFLEKKLKEYSPKTSAAKAPEKYTQDPLNTLFVGRLSYSTDEKKLKEVFSKYGEIKSVFLVRSKEGKSRGYGFIEFASGRDMKDAYRKANKLDVDGRQILTDVERGRTVKDWKPRRLGGGLGGANRRENRTRNMKESRHRKR